MSATGTMAAARTTATDDATRQSRRPPGGLMPVAMLVAALATLGGCASPKEHATFVTKTSFSLVDVDTAPPGVSIAYDRVEGYLGPRFDDGTVYPVAGSLETHGAGFDRQIRQVYAAGDAARIVTAQPGTAPPPPRPVPQADGRDNKVLFFGTATSVGLKIGFADGAPLPTSFSLGYKRKEASVIPVDRERQPSVLASFDNAAGVRAAQAGGRAGAEFGVEQFFATGRAAENLAGRPSIKDRFQDKAVQAMGEVQAYRNSEAQQGRLALDTLNCFARLGDDQLEPVWRSAAALKLFDPTLDTLGAIAKTPDPRRKRAFYIGELSALDADSAAHTEAMAQHRKAVCDLAKTPS